MTELKIPSFGTVTIETGSQTDPSTSKENKIRKSKKIMTKYEIAEVIAERARQIELGIVPNISLESKNIYNKRGEIDPALLAEEELRQGKTPFVIKRYFPDGTFDNYRTGELLIP